ncbi:MAG: hypothetical protein MJ059_01975 [Lachnospiraceae bacterium]|nr:hypothetical protein [Lachnospiraceae bacterium]
MKDKMSLEDFIKYAKQKCGIDISLIKDAGPLTFREIFGGSFFPEEPPAYSVSFPYEQNVWLCNYTPLASDETIKTDLDAA